MPNFHTTVTMNTQVAMINPEDYLLEEVDRPIISRKRKYRASMTEGSLEESKNELLALKKVRKVSPATQTLVDCMLDTYADLKTAKIGSPAYFRNRALILKQEAILESKLAKEQKYAVLFEEFRKLKADSLRLRYGDYHKGNVSLIKVKSQEIARQNKEPDVLSKMNWQGVLQHIEVEKGEMEDYEYMMNIRWWNSENGIQNDTEEPEEPETPITKLIQELSELCKMKYDHVIFEIQEYTKRNDVAHSGIDEFIATNKWMEVAEIITRDIQSIEDGLLGRDKIRQANMMKTLKTFSDRYFAHIEPLIDPVSGIKTLSYFIFSDEELQRQTAMRNAKAADESQKMKRKESVELLAKAQSATHIGYSLKKAQKEVLEAQIDMNKKIEVCRKAQAESGQAMKDYKDALYRYKKLLKGPVED